MQSLLGEHIIDTCLVTYLGLPKLNVTSMLMHVKIWWKRVTKSYIMLELSYLERIDIDNVSRVYVLS